MCPEMLLYDECNIDAIKQGIGWGSGDDDCSDDDADSGV